MASPIRLLTCSEAGADLYAFRRGREPQCAVRIVRGQRCAVMDRCMAEWAAVMQFPYCFEGTWASFRQSLCELDWASSKSVVLLLTNVHRILPRSQADFVEMLTAIHEWGASENQNRPSSLQVVLHAEPRFAEVVTRRLESGKVLSCPVEE